MGFARGAWQSLQFMAETLRVPQWSKNLWLFAGFVFAGRARQSAAVWQPELARVLLSILAFCLLSSAAYLVNDLLDLDSDRLHPEKRRRPLASGRLPIGTAKGLAAMLAIAGLGLAALVSLWSGYWFFLLVSLAYLVQSTLYTLYLKHEVILDVLVLAVGFVLRVVAGCVALPVPISEWLIFCTLTLALFMALCKRRGELGLMGDEAGSTREVLNAYSPRLLDLMIGVAASMTLMGYTLYTFFAPHIDFIGNNPERGLPWLMVTILNVVYGLFRYLYLAYQRDVGGKPERMLRDARSMINLIIWAAIVVALSLFVR